MPRTRAFLASSLDGFIAGPDHEIGWLSQHKGVEDTFTPFFAEIGAMLMGRRTYDVVCELDGPWPYGDVPVLIGTRSTLKPKVDTVKSVRGTIEELVQQAKDAAGDKDVYVDGGALTRATISAGLLDEITVTMLPVAIGAGISLFGGLEAQQRFELLRSRQLDAGLVELVYRPIK